MEFFVERLTRNYITEGLKVLLYVLEVYLVEASMVVKNSRKLDLMNVFTRSVHIFERGMIYFHFFH